MNTSREMKSGVSFPVEKELICENGKSTARKKIDVADLEPPDGGWGWMVAFATCVILALTLMPVGIYGILYTDILMKENVSTTTVAWIFNLQHAMTNFFPIFCTPLCAIFGYRKVAFSGCFSCGFAIIMTGFSTKPYHLFLTYSLLFGSSLGFAIPPCSFILPQYFKKYRGRAMGLMMASVGISYFISPIILNLLQMSYGFKGAIFIVGAIMLNACVAASLFHPVEWHAKVKEEKADDLDKTFPLLQNSIRVNTSQHSISQDQEKSCRNSLKVPKEKINLNRRNNLKSNLNEEEKIRRIRYISENSVASFNSTFDLHVSSHNCNKSSSKSIASPRENIIEEDMSIKFQFSKILRSVLLNLLLIKSHRVKIIVATYSFILISTMNSLMMIPFTMVERGRSLEDASWLISFYAIGGTVSRLLVSTMVDKLNLSTKYYFMFGSLCTSLSILALTLTNNWQCLVAASCFFGCGFGTCVVLISLISIEFMGIELFSQTYSLITLTISFVFIVNGPLIGLIRDVSASYIFTLRMLSIIAILPFLTFLFMPLAQRIDKRNNVFQPARKDNDLETS